MARRLVPILILFLALTVAGCDQVNGRFEGRKIFTPLCSLARGHLELNLTDQKGPGELIVMFISFSGERLALQVVNLPSDRPLWGWDLGPGAAINGRPFAALEIERTGDGPPIKYVYRPFSRPKDRSRGLSGPAAGAG